MYAMEIYVSGIKFIIEQSSLDQLLEDYAQAGGDPKWFAAKVQEVVPEYESGKRDLRSLRVDNGSGDLRETVAKAREEVQGDMTGVDKNAWDDGWGARSDSKGSGQEDPWSGDPVDEKPAQRRTEPSRGKRDNAPVRDDADANVYKKRDNWGNTWTMNLPDAPDCFCGVPAARADLKSKAGKPYTKFKCAKGVGDDWREKCEYDEWPPK